MAQAGSQPMDHDTDLLQEFVTLRKAVRLGRIGNGGTDTCAALTESLDRAIRQLAADVGPGAAVVALGGYGRAEQCLWSDVDVMLLHSGGDPDPLVKRVLYPLWDANLKVGHAVRTLKECRDAGREQLETLTSLLSGRLVAGDPNLFADYESMLVELVQGKPLARQLAEEERKRRLADPYPVMAADVKEGRGALRTHQGFWWERRRRALLGLPSDEPDEFEAAARDDLLAIRNALHAAAGRAVDEFVLGLREPAANWLGTDVKTLAATLTRALHTGDRLADRRWPDLHAEHDPMVGLGRKIFGAIRSRFSSSSDSDRSTDAGVLTVAVAAAARPDGARFADAEEEAIRTAGATVWTPSQREALVQLLTAGERGRTIFGLLEDLGWVERELPEWAAVSAAPQLAPFHEHPVDAHLWRTVDEMQALLGEKGEAAQIAGEIGSTEELVLGAFLHDIGKGRGGDHAEVGASLAADLMRRTGYGPATTAAVTNAVRYHLLLSETAMRRDIADPAVIDEVAGAVGDLRQLQLLYLLTIADLRATGSTMWNGWKSTLLHGLYVRAATALEAGGAPSATPDVRAIAEAAPEGIDRRSIEEHVAAMGTDYLETATPGDVLWHMDATAGLNGAAKVLVDPSHPGRVLVVGADRDGFLLAVSRAFAMNGVAVLDARLRTRADGIAIDTFHVADDRTGDTIGSERWDRVSADLDAALNHQRDLRPAIRERVRAYRRPGDEASPITVRAHGDGRHTTIEVRMPDRVGLLTEIVEALHGEGLDVHYAKIDTLGGQARDVFHVRRTGVPIRVAGELEALRRRIEDRLKAE